MSATINPITRDTEYFAANGLSNSGMKDLAVSPLRYWHKHLNPERPKDEPTPEMQFGSAVHCAVLEPGAFLDRYACEVSAEDYPGCLVTMDDLRGWLNERGIKPKGTRKADAIAQVQAVDPEAPILEVIERRHLAENAGKVILKKSDWQRVYRAADALRSEPEVQRILSAGEPEVAMFATDPETGVTLKAKMDWVSPASIADIKTFSQQRGRSIDESVTKAIWYEGYHKQAFTYSYIRALKGGLDHPQTNGEFIFLFVESEEPFETRIRVLRPKSGGEVSLLWERARIEVRALIQRYAECMAHFGTERPWRYAQEADPLVDQEFPGVIF